MKFFIDTANVEEIKKANDMGIICGVTTNPSLIAKEGRDFNEVIAEITSIVDGPISGEVKATTVDAEGMIAEGREIAKIHPNMVVKIPMTAEGLKATKILASKGIKTNVTLIFSASQALLAARAGASYVSSAMFLAFAMYNPEATVYLMYVIPVKMKWVAWMEAALYTVNVILNAMAGQWGMALMPIIAMLNLFVFLAPEFGRKADRVKAHHRPQAVQFRQAVKEQQKQKGYNHKCCVCGKTDTDHPELQFRYCSKCAGYHCYCEEHIFNHVHYTE